jgi:uncharacterized delta-60 repeat protein
MSRTRTALRAEALEDRLAPAAAGTLDPTFAAGGKLVVATPGAGGPSAVDSLGRVIVAGSVGVPGNLGTESGDVVVLRFNPDGTPDTTFGTGGRVTIDFNGNLDLPGAVAVDAGDNIVVAASSNDFHNVTRTGFARLRAADGSFDPTFGVGGTGRIVIDPPAGDTSLTPGQLVLDAAGRPVLGGSASTATAAFDIAVVRLTADGSMLDPTFNGGAVKTITQTATSTDIGGPIAVDSSGRIVVAGDSQDGFAPGAAAVARLNPDGSFDPTFNGGNLLVSEVFGGAVDDATAVATDGGLIYLTGITSKNPAGAGQPVARLTGSGAPDTTFGTNGVVVVTPQSASGTGSVNGVGIKVAADGRVVIAGNAFPPGLSNGDFAVARLLPDGTPDPLFNPAGSPPGTNVFDLGFNANDQVASLALAPDGKIVAAGNAFNAMIGGMSTTAIAVARLTSQAGGPLGRPHDLSVGGAENATANVYAPDASGHYANPPARQIAHTVFPASAGEVRTATADVNGDGVEDTVLVTGPGVKTQMAVVSGKDGSLLLAPSDPFGDANFTFGGFVTAGDIDGDGRAEWVVTPELRGGPRVIIFGLNADGTLKLVANFFGIQDDTFRDGARAALGDVNSDGVLDVFAIAAFNGGPRTALFDGKDVLVATSQNRAPNKLVGDFFAAPSGQDEGRGGRTIAAGDVNGDGVADLAVSGDNLLGTGNQVVIFSGGDLLAGRFPGFGATPLANFAVGGQDPAALVSVATVNADGDARADLAVGSGAGQPSLVKVYLGRNLTGPAEPASTSLDPFGSTTLNGVFVG